MRSLELLGARVLNGANVFALELSNGVQATLLRTLGIDTPRSITFNDPAALHQFAGDIGWPAVLKPDQGGSGARIQVVESLAEVDDIFRRDPSIWLPDNLFLLQEYLAHDPDQGIVRLEFVGGELLYAMRVKTHGRFNLCPSPVCNPDEGDSACALPGEAVVAAPPVEFSAFHGVPQDAVRLAKRIVQAAGLDVGGIEYPRDRGRTARVLRHQRQLEPAAVRGRRVRVRSVRARGGLPGGGAAEVAGWGVSSRTGDHNLQFATSGAGRSSASRRIVTICSSVNRVFFMAPPGSGGRHSLKLQLVRKTPGRSERLINLVTAINHDIEIVLRPKPRS